MNTPARILRADFDRVDPAPPSFTARQRERHDRILLAGRVLMARHGRANISFAAFGKALRIGAATLAWHFTDLDDLLGAILRAHLRAILRAIKAIPDNAPNAQAKRAANCRALTHTEAGDLTEAQTLLSRDLALLPDDVRLGLEATLRDIESRLGTSLLSEAPPKAATVPANVQAPPKPQFQKPPPQKPPPQKPPPQKHPPQKPPPQKPPSQKHPTSRLLHALQTGTHLRPVTPTAIDEWLGVVPRQTAPPRVASPPAYAPA